MRKTLEDKRADRAERLARAERSRLVSEACADEIARFNESVSRTPIRVNSPGALSHGDTVLYMSGDFWLKTNRMSWCYCNDGRWADLLRQAGVTRNPLFA